MNIEISVKEIDEMYDLVARRVGAFGTTGWHDGGESVMTGGNVRSGAAFGRVSHQVAEPAKEPPSVMTAATTGNEHVDGADIDIDKEKDVPTGDTDLCEAYTRAVSVADFIIKNLLDFEAWLDERLFIDEDATVEHVRFNADVAYDGRAISMRHLTEYKNADRCKVPREDRLIRKWELPDDDALEDFEANVVRDCVRWACSELGIDVGEYLDRDGKAGGGDKDETRNAPERHEACGDNTEDATEGASDVDVAYVWSIVNDRLSALERWVNSKVGNGGISVYVTCLCDIVRVRIVKLSDKECGPLIVKDTKVGKGRDNHSCAEGILSDAYDVVFGTFDELSYSEFIESISVATDGK